MTKKERRKEKGRGERERKWKGKERRKKKKNMEKDKNGQKPKKFKKRNIRKQNIKNTQQKETVCIFLIEKPWIRTWQQAHLLFPTKMTDVKNLVEQNLVNMQIKEKLHK